MYFSIRYFNLKVENRNVDVDKRQYNGVRENGLIVRSLPKFAELARIDSSSQDVGRFN